jgi:hypothetical protein
MELQEMKQKIKDYFVEINEDKFTKVKTIECKHNIIWSGKDLENKFMLTEKKLSSHQLKMGIDYRHKDEVDSVFFIFIYDNTDGGYPGMTNIKMYLILDDDKNIELSESSGFHHTSQSSKVGGDYISVYVEIAQLKVSMSDFIAIANAKKIEYSIRFGKGALENTFKKSDLTLLKGFYNAAFDEDFEVSELDNFLNNGGDIEDDVLKEWILDVFIRKGNMAAVKEYQKHTGDSLANAVNYVSKLESKIKKEKAALYNDPIEKYFLSEDKFKEHFFNKEASINLIQSDSGFFGIWKKGLSHQFVTDELKIGIKCNKFSKAPKILIFPVAFLYNDLTRLYQINYNKIKSIDLKKGFSLDTVIITDDEFTHKIEIQENISNLFVSFLNSEITKNDLISEYIITKEEKAALYNDPIEKYFLSEDKFKEHFFNKEASINLIQSDTGFFSFWKKGLAHQVITDELKIGIKSTKLSKSPIILIFPAAFVYTAITRLFQVNYNKIKSIDIKKGFAGASLIITDDEFIHKIENIDNEIANFFISFLNSEITKNDLKAEYIIK